MCIGMRKSPTDKKRKQRERGGEKTVSHGDILSPWQLLLSANVFCGNARPVRQVHNYHSNNKERESRNSDKDGVLINDNKDNRNKKMRTRCLDSHRKLTGLIVYSLFSAMEEDIVSTPAW